jgi:hypothetical protein
MGGVIPPFFLYAFMVCIGTALLFSEEIKGCSKVISPFPRVAE